MLFAIELFFILLVGNLAALLSWLFKHPVNSGAVNITLALFLYLYVAFKYRFRFSRGATDLKSLARNLVISVAAGLVITLPPLVFFLFPVLVSNIDYTPIKSLSVAALLFRILMEIPFFTAVSEELLFRQYIYTKIKAEQWRGMLLNGLIFTGWHFVVVLRTILDTSFSQNLFLTLLSYLGALISVFIGGLLFVFVRQKTGSFLYSAVTHWLNVALMTMIIWLL
jgi:membrane protease YdiL (CAAX protease family)